MDVITSPLHRLRTTLDWGSACSLPRKKQDRIGLSPSVTDEDVLADSLIRCTSVPTVATKSSSSAASSSNLPHEEPFCMKSTPKIISIYRRDILQGNRNKIFKRTCENVKISQLRVVVAINLTSLSTTTTTINIKMSNTTNNGLLF